MLMNYYGMMSISN